MHPKMIITLAHEAELERRNDGQRTRAFEFIDPSHSDQATSGFGRRLLAVVSLRPRPS